MGKPMTKAELLSAADAQYEKLWALIDGMSDEEQHAAFPFEDRDRNLRDVLVHLYEWHRMCESWHQIGTIEGGKPAVPGEGYTWRTLPALNHEIWARYQHMSLDDAKAALRRSHKDIMALIESHTDEELYGKNVYPWTKTSTLGAYFGSNTASHYEWAMKKLRKFIKLYR